MIFQTCNLISTFIPDYLNFIEILNSEHNKVRKNSLEYQIVLSKYDVITIFPQTLSNTDRYGYIYLLPLEVY